MKTMAILIMILSLINMINEFDVAYKENDGGDNENSDDRVSEHSVSKIHYFDLKKLKANISQILKSFP